MTVGTAPKDAVYGKFRFNDPDLSVEAKDRGIFCGPASKLTREETIELHDMRTSPNIAKDSHGLDVQGFTYVEHASSLTAEELLTGTNVEDRYVPNFRRKITAEYEDPYYFKRAGGEWDEKIKRYPVDKLMVHGRNNDAREPARLVHCDMNLKTLSRTLRVCRQDILDAGPAAIAAEEERKNGKDVRVPRYASFRVWRPLKTVKRDPIALLDYRSVNLAEVVDSGFRVPSALLEDKEYIVESRIHRPPTNPRALKWYYLPQQRSDEVMVIKFSDSESDEDDMVAANCFHCSLVLPGTKDEEARESVECRVYVIWE